MDKTPFFLVTGFLGSGKTTLLGNIIEKFSDSYRIGVIQNEFAPGSVDGSHLKQKDKQFEILEVNNGSVFCVCLLGSFVKSLSSFIDTHHPDMLVMEASGLSDPISIGEMLHSPDLSEKIYLSHIWSVVDASNFHNLAVKNPRIRHQVRIADTVVLNKTDRAGAGTEEMHEWIRTLNPFAIILETRWCNVPIELRSSPFSLAPVAVRQKESFDSLERSGRPEVGSYVIKLTNKISRENLMQFLEELGPGSWRIKGFVLLKEGGALAIQSCFGETKTELMPEYDAPTELIGIGPGISRESFGDRFSEQLKKN